MGHPSEVAAATSDAGLSDRTAPSAANPTPGAPLLVPLRVSEAKLAAELADWDANAVLYQRRGWLLLSRKPLRVEVAFITAVPIVGLHTVPVITACVRLDYANYDLWPPSLTFIDPRTREPAAPAVRAPDMTEAGARDALVDGHPDTGRPFLCLAGIREYHNHPQHTGDDWLLHRVSGAGRLAVICERIWQRMVRNVVGLRVTMQALPPSMGTQLEVVLAQGNLAVTPAGPGGPTRRPPDGTDAVPAPGVPPGSAHPTDSQQPEGTSVDGNPIQQDIS